MFLFQEWVAQLNGPVNAEITPKVQGYLLRQDYQNGYFVKKGQLLFELDPRQYQAAVEQAKAQVAVAQAKLAEATTNVDRDTPLAAQNAIPQKQLDTDLAEPAAWQGGGSCPAGQPAECRVEPGVDQGLLTHRRYCGRVELADRRPGGHRDEDGDGLPGQSHLGLLQCQREHAFSVLPMR